LWERGSAKGGDMEARGSNQRPQKNLVHHKGEVAKSQGRPLTFILRGRGGPGNEEITSQKPE